MKPAQEPVSNHDFVPYIRWIIETSMLIYPCHKKEEKKKKKEHLNASSFYMPHVARTSKPRPEQRENHSSPIPDRKNRPSISSRVSH